MHLWPSLRTHCAELLVSSGFGLLAYSEMTLFLGDFLILDSSVLFLGLIHCECLLVKDYFLIVELDEIRYRYWVIYDMTSTHGCSDGVNGAVCQLFSS